MLADPSPGEFLSNYGYIAIFLGTLLEGESIAIAAGFLAHQGYFALPWVIVSAIVGSLLSDQGMFFLSRAKGSALLSRLPKLAAKVKALAEKMRSRRGALTSFTLLFRFFYGMRNIAPIFLGISAISTSRFVLLNALAAVVWAVLFSFAGYAFSQVVSIFTGTLALLEVLGILLCILAPGLFFAWRRWKKHSDFTNSPSDDRTR